MSMSNYPMICVNCQDCLEGDDEFICENEVAIFPDLVRGGVLYRSCEEMRSNPTLCGKTGMLFTEKENLEDFWNSA